MPQHAPRKPDPIDVHIGSRLRLARLAKNLSQEKLGDKFGVTFQQVQKYERGDNRMGGSRLWQASQALELPITYFFEGLDGQTNFKASPAETDQILSFINSSYGVAFSEALARIPHEIRVNLLKTLRSMAGLADNAKADNGHG